MRLPTLMVVMHNDWHDRVPRSKFWRLSPLLNQRYISLDHFANSEEYISQQFVGLTLYNIAIAQFHLDSHLIPKEKLHGL